MPSHSQALRAAVPSGVTSFVYFAATSIDGYIADENDSLDWLFAVAEADPEMANGFMATVGVQVMGSTTYRWLLDHEDLLAHPEKWSTFFGELPTVVFSSQAQSIPDGADVTVVSGDVAAQAEALVAAAQAKDVWIVGGGNLAGQFLDAGLLDRLNLSVAPAFLGGGAPLLPRTFGSDRLRLVRAEQAGPFARLVFDVIAPDPVADLYVAAVAIRDDEGRVLVVRKRGTDRYMLPGGKIEPGESPADTAVRELREEVDIALDPSRLSVLGDWTAPAANEPGLLVHGHVLTHPWVAGAHARAEIEDLQWLSVEEMRDRTDLAPLLVTRVLPHL